MFDKGSAGDSGRVSALERRLTDLLDGLSWPRPANGPAFVIDLVDAPVREAWLRGRIMNRPLQPGSIGVGTLARLLEAGVTHLKGATAADRVIARAAADRARELAAFVRARPASLMDRGDGEVGAASAASRATRPRVLTAVSEWAVDEVAVALRMTGATAQKLLTDSLVLVDQLPATLALLEEGLISWDHARVLTELLAPVRDDKRAEVEARVLSRVEGKTPVQLRVATRRAVARVDAKAGMKRLIAAIRERHVAVYPGDDGMAGLSTVLPTAVARACLDALERYADACAVDGDDRTKAQRMADCLVDLILRPGENGLPPVQVLLTVVATAETMLGGDEPGEVDGGLVPAPMVRELAYELGLLPRPSSSADAEGKRGDVVADAALQADAAPEVTDSDGDVQAVADSRSDAGADVQVDARSDPNADPRSDIDHESDIHHESDICGSADGDPGADVEERRRALGRLLGRRNIAGSTLGHRPHIAVVDRLRGTLVALTDAVGVVRGDELRPPPDSPGYRPHVDLDRFVRLRDRRCRFPGCRARARRCDLDHTRPWPSGPTSHTNLCSLCQHHHRLSHQAPGWSLVPATDGGLRWRTPGGEVITTYPLRFGADDDLPVGAPHGAEPSQPGDPGGTNDPDDEPPPF